MVIGIPQKIVSLIFLGINLLQTNFFWSQLELKKKVEDQKKTADRDSRLIPRNIKETKELRNPNKISCFLKYGFLIEAVFSYLPIP